MTYELSTVRAQRVVDFIEQFLVVPEGKDVGKPVVLRDWQREFIDKVYSTPTRRAILSMGRKNGKSAITAMLLLAHLAGPEALPNSQIYSVPSGLVPTRLAGLGGSGYSAAPHGWGGQGCGVSGAGRRR